MSHFVVLVLSPNKPSSKEAAQEYVEDLLAPYDESRDVAPYLKDCYCIGSLARKAASEQAAAELGNMGDIRDKYWEEMKVLTTTLMNGVPENYANAEASREARDKASKMISPTWKERIQPIQDREEALRDEHPDKDKPDAGCEECEGTGKYKTRSNPNGKWDWWTIGGRWTGHLRPDYDPYKDPRNLKTCWLCHGTGKRDDELGRNFRLKDPTYTCNGCNGSGQEVVFASKLAEPPEGGNVALVSRVLQLLDEGHNLLPFAIIRPTGEWLEKGEMGWWGIVTDEKEAWPKAARSVLEEYTDHWAIVVDCHV